MNKKQLYILWLALLLFISMVWFPGEWFGYIIEGYPVLRPESIEFMVRILLPFAATTLLILYSLRDSKHYLRRDSKVGSVRAGSSSLMKINLVLAGGVLVGFIVGYFVLRYQVRPVNTVREEVQWVTAGDDEFRTFCKREGYKEEVNLLITWLRDKQAHEIAILYNGDDAYSHDLYTYFSEKIKEEQVTVTFSDMFKGGEQSFYSELKTLESLQPEAIIFLGTQEERLAFLETVSEQSQVAFWQDGLDKIKWIE
jgi:hypothetical protein